MSTSPSEPPKSKPHWKRRISTEVRHAVRSAKYQHHKLTRSASKTRAKGKAKAVFNDENSSNDAPATAPGAPLKRKRSCSCDRKLLSDTSPVLPQHKSRRFSRRIRSVRAQTKRRNSRNRQPTTPVKLSGARCKHFSSSVSFDIFVPEAVEAHAGPVTMASWKRAERERCRVRENERVEREIVEEMRRAGEGLGGEVCRLEESSDCFTAGPVSQSEVVSPPVLRTAANKDSTELSQNTAVSEPGRSTAAGYCTDQEVSRQRIMAYLNREAVDAWLGLHDADAVDLQLSDPTSSRYDESDENDESDRTGAEYQEYASVSWSSDDIEVEPAEKLQRRSSLIRALKRLRSSLMKRKPS